MSQNAVKLVQNKFDENETVGLMIHKYEKIQDV
jgi:hypothetical protein